MPRVNTTKGAEVAPQAAPNATITTSTPAHAFNVEGIKEQNQATRDTLQNVQKIIVLEKQKANKVAVQDADVQLSELQNNLQFESSKMLGKGSAGAPEFAQDEWSKGVTAIREGLSNDAQKQQFDILRAKRESNLMTAVQKHTFLEMQKYDEESTAAAVLNYRQEAVLNYDDSRAIERSILSQEDAYLGRLARTSQIPPKPVTNDPEEIAAWRNAALKDPIVKKNIRDIHEQTHSDVVTQMLSDANTDVAKEYYEANKDHLSPALRKEIKTVIDKESAIVNADKQAVDIMKSVGPNVGEIENHINDIKDPEVRKEVEKRIDPLVRQEIERQNNQQADIVKRMASGKYSLADLRRDRDALPNDMFNAIEFARSNNAQDKKFKDKWDGTYGGLWNDYLAITTGASEDRNEQFINLRKKILLRKPLLREDDYSELLKLTDPNFTTQLESEGKEGFFVSVAKMLWNSPVGDFARSRMIKSFMKEAANVSAEKLPETGQKIRKQEMAKNDPARVKYEVGKEYTRAGMTFVAVETEDGSIGLRKK